MKPKFLVQTLTRIFLGYQSRVTIELKNTGEGLMSGNRPGNRNNREKTREVGFKKLNIFKGDSSRNKYSRVPS